MARRTDRFGSPRRGPRGAPHGGVPDPRADAPALRAFVAVARLGTVGRAADALGRTQPSISARLGGLEQAWGTRLFRRRARGMSLTPEGTRLLPLAESALRVLEELDHAAGLPVAAPDEVRVGAGDALGRELLPRALASLLAEDPTVGVRILEGPGPRLLEALRAGEIDVALVVVSGSPPGGDEIEWQRLIDSPVDLLLPWGHPKRTRRSVALDSLRSERLVTLQPGSMFRRHLESAFARRGIPFRPAVEVGNLSLVRRFVAAGLGVAPVPALAFGGTPAARFPRLAGPGTPRVERCRLTRIERVTYYRASRRGVPFPESCRRLLELLI